MKTGVAIFAHGSSVESANDAVRTIAGQVAREGGFDLVEAAFLEQGKPDLTEAVRRLRERGASRILVTPYFLTLGLHLQRDLPRIVADIRRIQSDVEIHVTPPLDGHHGMVQALVDRAREGEKSWNAGTDTGEDARVP